MSIMEQRNCGLLDGLEPTSALRVGWTGLEGQDTPARIEARGESEDTGGSSFIQIWSKRAGSMAASPASSPTSSPAASSTTSPAAAPAAAPVFNAEMAVKQARSAYYVGFHGLLKKQGSKVEPLEQFVAKSL